MLLCSITSAAAQVSFGIGLPGVSIGINLPVYPQLVAVPGYPVYYAPQVNSNYFFYDGMYWVYQRDNWYASSWYNGPWGLVAPEAVPLFILRVPVRYYRHPPAYFRGWRSDAPPRWGEHWGNAWEQSHRGWDNWNRSSVPAPAPLPVYQRQYSGNRYPRAEQQQALQSQNYRYQPHDAVVQQHYQAQRVQSAPATSPPQDYRGTGRPSSPPQGAPPAPRGQPPQTGSTNVQRPPAVQAPPQQAGPAVSIRSRPRKQRRSESSTHRGHQARRRGPPPSRRLRSRRARPPSVRERATASPARAAGTKVTRPGAEARTRPGASAAGEPGRPASTAAAASGRAAGAAGTKVTRSGQGTARQGVGAGIQAGPGQG